MTQLDPPNGGHVENTLPETNNKNSSHLKIG